MGPAKAAANERKHRLSFAFVAAIFTDALAIDYDVSRPEDREGRRKVVGMVEGRLLTVVYTLRAGVVRIISARRANSQEARRYGDR